MHTCVYTHPPTHVYTPTKTPHPHPYHTLQVLQRHVHLTPSQLLTPFMDHVNPSLKQRRLLPLTDVDTCLGNAAALTYAMQLDPPLLPRHNPPDRVGRQMVGLWCFCGCGVFVVVVFLWLCVCALFVYACVHGTHNNLHQHTTRGVRTPHDTHHTPPSTYPPTSHDTTNPQNPTTHHPNHISSHHTGSTGACTGCL